LVPDRALSGLAAIDHPAISTVRGKGLLNAIVINPSDDGKQNAGTVCYTLKELGTTSRLTDRALSSNCIRCPLLMDGAVLCVWSCACAAGMLAKPTHEHIIRLAPPLVISAEQVDEAVALVETAVRRVFG
jgi:ornithine--oxo-acid transaminase